MLDHSALGRWIDSPNKPVWRGLFIRLSSLGKGSQQRSDVPLESWASVTLWQTQLPRVLQNWHFPQGAKSQGTYAFGFRHAESQTMAPLLAWEKDTYFMSKLKRHWKCSLETMMADEPALERAYDGTLALKPCLRESGRPKVLEAAQLNKY